MPALICRSMLALFVALAVPLFAQSPDATSPEAISSENASPGVLKQDNLVAWCIVPFDAAKRSPAERAQMLVDLGIRRCAYDWRAEHVASFEQEILEYRKHGIEFFAFWGGHPEAYRLFEKHDLHPQIWMMPPNPREGTQEEKIQQAAEQMVSAAQETQRLGCKLSLYNHGGWPGEPENLVGICRALRDRGFEHVGITYNWHHGHEHIDDWSKSFALMRPYLHCLNLNGMNDGANPKILGISKGKHEQDMIRVVAESGYQGPIGILDHRPELDAKESLLENIEGLRWIRDEMKQPGSGGAKPKTPVPPASVRAESAQPITPGTSGLFPGSPNYRQPPITVECRATLKSADGYNILVSSDAKRSANHWELFSMANSGTLTAYLPGRQPDHVRSEAVVTDGKPHTFSMIYEPARVRLFVDGKQVADQRISPPRGRGIDGGLGIGRLVQRSFQFNGVIDWVRVSRGVRPISSSDVEKVSVEDDTLGVWKVDGESGKIRFVGKSMRADQPAAEADSEASTPPTAVLPYDPKLVEALVSEAMQQGDAVRGARVFASAQTACLSCHEVGSHGGTVGPRLSAMEKPRELSHLVESVLWPDREIAPEYVNWKVLTEEGQVLTGYRTQSDEESVTLRDPASGKETVIDADNIVDEIASGTPMPAGLAAAMTREQQRDLIRFLAEVTNDKRPLPSELMHVLAQSQSHGPVSFPYTLEPVSPERWQHAKHQVNRDRIYDFYTKQAEHFRKQDSLPMLLSPYPGLDGGQHGHWGNQTEETWASDGWQQTVQGSVLAGVFRGDGKTVPRGVCVQLDSPGEHSVCFDPDTLSYAAAWEGGFVTTSSVRHGFVSGLKMQGKPIPVPSTETPKEPFEYHGFYRHGNRVVFLYRIGETEYLDSPRMKNGQLVIDRMPASEHPLRDALAGGPAQWPQTIGTQIVPGSGQPFALDTIELPHDNPWKALLFCSGHDFLPDGSALVCTMQGDVWKVSGLQAPGDQPAVATWRRFASGLHQPLGLVVANDGIYVQCRDQLTRLTDLNGDGEADFYECFSNAFQTSPAGHDFICGLQRDDQGNFYTASGNQGLLRISPDGDQADVIATGFRNPDGLGIFSDGTVTVPCSEGGWTPASMICAVPSSFDESAGQTPPHYGYRGPQGNEPPSLPLVYLPRGMDNSSGGQAVVPPGVWGPLQEQLLHLSFGTGTWFTVLQDEVDGQVQGAVVPMAGDFLSGAHRGRFSPADQQLYVSGSQGWGAYVPEEGSFQRVRWTGQTFQVPTGFHVHENGVRITFAEPVDPSIAANVQSHFAQSWNYRYSGAYGSPEYSPMHPGVAGHDPVAITSAHVLSDSRTVFLEIPDLQPVNQLHLRLHVNEDDQHVVSGPTEFGHDLFVTVHSLDAAFQDFPGYRSVEKTIAAHPILSDLALNAIRVPNPWRKPIPNAKAIELKTGTNLTYQTKIIRVKAGEPLAFTLVNPDVVPHNWALVRPGALQEVGELANQLIADPEAFARHYIPDTEDVLVATDVVGPGESQTVHFRAPSQPGRYPFLCTFPGHWMVMNGEMIVE
ncbi:Glucose dehydrogenase, PQQ-dependent [Rhodopirellula islandica]|uniref:Glucose dehydrogenase, PQQ-dependent n=1 Tax=Rhodopirellula islandica TaxID=595434 RepID=A0A0J1BGE9_RHOIS|nr:DUF6797 domain-containing protein [Rhodopirellula islandica]KLU05617.1 Glucose dehydrogenase, PQQ-dependent [Rhodopirellula islandica]